MVLVLLSGWKFLFMMLGLFELVLDKIVFILKFDLLVFFIVVIFI